MFDREVIGHLKPFWIIVVKAGGVFLALTALMLMTFAFSHLAQFVLKSLGAGERTLALSSAVSLGVCFIFVGVTVLTAVRDSWLIITASFKKDGEEQ